MPYLRFARDKRGYETTSLIHAYGGRSGRGRQKVLYWFRSPPNVKVGRPALDQDAIRWIEEHNPDIEFDWPVILQATAPPAPMADDARGRRTRKGRTDRPERSAGDRQERRPQRTSPAPPRPSAQMPVPDTPLPSEMSSEPAPASAPAPVPVPVPEHEPELRAAEVAAIPALPTREEEALEQITHPDAEEAVPVSLSAVETVLGREQLIRFRARYAELQARIIEHRERGGEPARMEELRAQAEPLNPDSWVTLEEARAGLEQFEPKIRELRAALGLKRRRRSRRGGRRRRGGQGAPGLAGEQTTTADSSSNSPDILASPSGGNGGNDEAGADDEEDGDDGDAS